VVSGTLYEFIRKAVMGHVSVLENPFEETCDKKINYAISRFITFFSSSNIPTR
jgi:hypothetical protein